jgi:hypothetical protein
MRPVEALGERVEVARIQVAVAVERLSGRAVAEHRLTIFTEAFSRIARDAAVWRRS